MIWNQRMGQSYRDKEVQMVDLERTREPFKEDHEPYHKKTLNSEALMDIIALKCD